MEFKPERFEMPVKPWRFIPFSGGPRVCIGQQFALTEAASMIVRILQRFDKIVPADREEMEKMRKGLGLVMWPADSVRVKLHEATDCVVR